jgi:hypothetical protein
MKMDNHIIYFNYAILLENEMVAYLYFIILNYSYQKVIKHSNSHFY